MTAMMAKIVIITFPNTLNISQYFNTTYKSKSSFAGNDLKDRLKYLQEELDFKLDVRKLEISLRTLH